MNTQIPKMYISLNSSGLSSRKSVKFLGMNIDNYYNFFTYIKQIKHKIIRFI